jgi:hypothetical protein
MILPFIDTFLGVDVDDEYQRSVHLLQEAFHQKKKKDELPQKFNPMEFVLSYPSQVFPKCTYTFLN